MTRECHNQIPQTNPQHCEEESKEQYQQQDIQNTTKVKTTSSLFPSEMTAK